MHAAPLRGLKMARLLPFRKLFEQFETQGLDCSRPYETHLEDPVRGPHLRPAVGGLQLRWHVPAMCRSLHTAVHCLYSDSLPWFSLFPARDMHGVVARGRSPSCRRIWYHCYMETH